MASRHWLYFGGFLVTSVLLVGVALMGVLDALSVLTTGIAYGEGFILFAMLGAAAEWIVGGIVLVLIALVFLFATVISVLRSASIPRDDRLVVVVEWLERKYPPLEQFDVTEKVEPTVDDRQDRLRDQYLAGELSDDEFERQLERLMDDAESTRTTGSHTQLSSENDNRR